MADKEAERIKFETEMLKLTAALATIAGGGSLSLLLGNPPIERLSWRFWAWLLLWVLRSRSGGNAATFGGLLRILERPDERDATVYGLCWRCPPVDYWRPWLGVDSALTSRFGPPLFLFC